ncbi:unnamed protein product [Phaeothamnion confervicola]
MPPKSNPLNLNMLQLKTLTLLQELARHPEAGTALEDGGFQISRLPQPHGDHFHIGQVAVRASDATGLSNEMVWKALERKTLAQSAYPQSITLSPAGIAYDTGLRHKILHGADH